MKQLIFAAMLVLSFATLAYAKQHNSGYSADHVGQAKGAVALTEGEVRRVDKDAKKLTIRHAPIQNLDMPAMTMVFQVKDPAMLDKVNTGDKIRFSADKMGGAYTVTGMERVK